MPPMMVKLERAKGCAGRNINCMLPALLLALLLLLLLVSLAAASRSHLSRRSKKWPLCVRVRSGGGGGGETKELPK